MPMPADAPLTDDDLAALRRAAALVHAVTHVGLEVLDAGAPCLRVGPPPIGEHPARVRQVPP